MELLKKFAFNATKTSMLERISLFEDLFKILEDKTQTDELPESFYKTLGKMIYYLYPIYTNKKSKVYLIKLIKILTKINCEQSLKPILQSLDFHSKIYLSTYPNRSTSMSSVYGIDLLNELILDLNQYKPDVLKSNDEFKDIITIYANFFFSSNYLFKKELNKLLSKKIKYICDKISGISIVILKSLTKIAESSLHSLVLAHFLMKYLDENKTDLNEYKNIFLDTYIKYMLGMRVKPTKYLIQSSNLILRYTTRADFKEKFLPAIQRSLLRNPEIVIELISFLFDDLIIDLSEFSNDLINVLSSQLLAKDETNRQESANAIKSLAKQCSDFNSIQNIIKRLFYILNGGEGKISTPIQKCVILVAIGNTSFNSSKHSEDILAKIIQLFYDYMNSETHDTTLQCAVEQLNLWFLKPLASFPLSQEFINNFNLHFKKFFEIKTLSPTVRGLLINAITNFYTKNSILHEGSYLFPVFIQSIEKAVNQFTQLQLLYEAINSALFLVTSLITDPKLESKNANILNLIIDTKKQLFTNEKFFLYTSHQGLINYCILFNKLNHLATSKDNVDLNSYSNGFVYALLHPDYDIRKTAQIQLKKLWTWSGCKLAIQLLDTIQYMLANSNLFLNTDKTSDKLEINWPSSKAICECALAIVSIPNLTRNDLEILAVKVLLLANNKLAKSFDSLLYNKCLHRLLITNKSNINILPLDLIQSKINSFMELTVNGETLDETQLNSIQTLANIDNKQYLKEIVNYSLNILSDNRLTNVTKIDYDIMKLKNGELYDKTLIENVLKMQESINQNANIKRENKAYSYKEQLAEIELKKEIEKKKQTKTQAIVDNMTNLEFIRSQLTKKQQESLDFQIEKESKIRQNMRNLDNMVNKATTILITLIQGNKDSIKDYIVRIVNTIVNLIKSPLCCSYVFKIYKDLANKVYMSSIDLISYGNSIVYCFTRLSDSPLIIEPNWNIEPIEKCYKRLLVKIKSESLVETKENKIDISKAAFLLPFLHFCIIKLMSKKEEVSIENIVSIIKIYSLHRLNIETKILEREKKHNDKTNEFNENFENECEQDELILSKLVNNFPTSEIISLLFKIISSIDSIKIQNEVNETLKVIFNFTSKLDHVSLTSENLILQFHEISRNLISPLKSVRETCLDCITILISVIKFLDEFSYQNILLRIWICCFDSDENNRQKALNIWNESNMLTNEKLPKLITDDIVHTFEHVRLAAAEALAASLRNHQNIINDVLDLLVKKYHENNKIIEPQIDQFGRKIGNEELFDNWESRSGIANTLVFLADLIPNNYVVKLYTFFVNYGLNDRNEFVMNKMLEGAIASLNKHGNANKNELLTLFENFLENAPKLAEYDSVRQNVVLLMGTLAKHLEKEDPKIPPIIGKLVQALQTPSQQVQEAVANCLYPLMPSIKSQVPNYVNQMMDVLLTAQSYGERRGAAYGLAGMLKGIGMLSLKQLNILQRLHEAVNNKGNSKQREGALLAYEMLTVMFNKVFEPYSVEILPNLLLCFGDADPNVRAAADDCAKAIMANLTFTGVKMILPKLLEHLGEDESWRTKCGSVELLGAMAHCAPKQLGTCLPSIVPKLTEVLSDSHVKVQKSATQALQQIASVIKNPEVLAITSTLLEALQDPAQKTQHALHILLETKFVHFIDAASLALIMPVVHRAFQDRSTETRKMAAQIMGNMYALTDQKDLQPYLPSILPGLKLSLLDPVPEVRSVSAKAMGAMIKAIGEVSLNDIVSWLMEKLVSETSSVDRSGAAQGLSEVFGALGVSKLEKSIPEIIERAEQVNLSPYVRDGYIMMFIYLPLTFQTDFTQYVGRIIPPILKALADENEFVRDTALKAGQRIVNTYAETAISLFLPELEKGLFDSNWRIRFSSVQLLGDLLYKISGVVGKMTTESSHEDDNFGTETGSKAIIHALGSERRNRVYAGLYMGRSDVSVLVRQAALHVWKIIVSNTPKTLKEILPVLFNLLLGCLASANSDKRQIAAATLVDIVRKLGERILPDIIPILEYGLNSERSEQRQGVCIGLTEIMASTSKDNILLFSDSLIPTVRKALMDPLPEVRNCAARTFDNLHNMIGAKALEDISIYLLNEMKSNQYKSDDKSKVLFERALDGLKQIMSVKSRVVLPYLINNLTQPPVNINALCILCSCAATDALSKHLVKILSTLVQSLSNYNENEGNWIQECESLLLSINDTEGIKTIVNELLTYISAVGESSNKLKFAAIDMLNWFCSKTEANYSNHLDDLIKGLLNVFIETDELLVTKAWNCLNCIIEPLKGNMLLQRLPAVRQSLRSLLQQSYQRSINKNNNLLFGFCLPKKGISCLLPVFKEGLLNGTPEIKEQASLTLTDCIKLANNDSLKSCVMTVTGPLIRVLGERYSWTVKSAVLDSIYYLLLKVDVTLRPFLPQLQPTFLKALNDPNSTVRLKSGYALAKLLQMNPRFDSVISEIIGYIRNVDDIQMKETTINALRLCLNNIGAKLSEDIKKQILQLFKTDLYLYSDEEKIRNVSAGAIGSLLISLNEHDFNILIDDITDIKKYSNLNWKYMHANCMLIGVALQYDASKLTSAKYDVKLFNYISSCISSDRTSVSMSGIRAAAYLIEDELKNNLKIETDLAINLAKCINNTSHDVKQLSAKLISYLSTRISKPLDSNLLKIFIPMLVNGTKERAPSVRIASEIALIHLLHLNKNNNILNDCLLLMDKMKETLNDCVKSINKESMVFSNTQEIFIDETLLKLDS